MRGQLSFSHDGTPSRATPVKSQQFARCLTVTAVTVLFGVPLAAQATSTALRLDEVLELVRDRNPRLRALRFAAQATSYRESEASTLPDPTLQLGMMNFGVPDLNTDMAMSMAPSVQLMQMVPFPGKLSLQGEVAAYGTEMAVATADEAWWNVRGNSSPGASRNACGTSQKSWESVGVASKIESTAAAPIVSRFIVAFLI